MRWSSRCQRSSDARERGATAVEFALVVPLLLVLTIGVFDFGYLAWEKLTLDQAVNGAARMAVAPNSNGGTEGSAVDEYDEIEGLVLNASQGLLPSEGASIRVNEQGAANAQTGGCVSLEVGDQLNITLTKPATPVVPMPLPGWGRLRSVTLTSVAVYRCEWTGR